MTFAPAAIAGKYQVLGIADKPKAGITYKVRNLVTGELEMLRVLPGATQRDPEARQRFLREIRVHARLSHPNIAAFHDALEFEGQLVMTGEYVEGVTVAERCRRAPLPPADAVRLTDAVLSALEEAHALDIVHRGITAEQVWITAAGEIKVGGFGLAKPAGDVNLTQAGAILGDPAYLSPEQILGGSALDGRSDLYAVGVLLYLALTGQTPFQGNEFDVMSAHVSNEPPAPGSLNPAIQPEMDRVVRTALAKRPEERFQNAPEFREALQRAASAPAPAGAPPPAPAPRRSRLPLVVGISVAVTAVIAAIVLAMH